MIFLLLYIVSRAHQKFSFHLSPYSGSPIYPFCPPPPLPLALSPLVATIEYNFFFFFLIFDVIYNHIWASLVAQRLKHLPAMRETWVQSLGQEDPLEKEMATHSNILAWRIPWTEEPGELSSMGL